MLGRGLFILANYNSCMHTTIGVWVYSSPTDPHSHAPEALSKAKSALFAEEMSLLNALRMHSDSTVYEPSFGGKLSKKTYDSIIAEIQAILIFIALMAETTAGIDSLSARNERWIRHLASVFKTTEPHVHAFSSLLCHLSAAISNGLTLTLYVILPWPFPRTRSLRSLNHPLPDLDRTADPAILALMALKILSWLLTASLGKLTSDVKLLVGEVTFDTFVTRRPTRKANTALKGE